MAVGRTTPGGSVVVWPPKTTVVPPFPFRGSLVVRAGVVRLGVAAVGRGEDEVADGGEIPAFSF